MKTNRYKNPYFWIGLCDYFGIDFSFLIKPKMNLLIRKLSSLKSKKIGMLDKNRSRLDHHNR